MADAELYDTDILAWSEQQAAALRELATRRDLPNALDLAHVVEEIADVGGSQLSAAKSLTRLILAHAIKCWADPDALTIRHWHAEMGNWHSELLDRPAPSMNQKIDLDIVWRRAVHQAILDLVGFEREAAAAGVRMTMSDTSCPVSMDGLIVVDPPDPGAVVDRLRARFPRAVQQTHVTVKKRRSPKRTA